jgi:crotonobetainyl-CoA:carnitine CoA-transferase CaiB-like acyl-CoA transferase
LAQLPFCFDYAGLEPFNEPSGRAAMGTHALSQFYKTWDDWIFIDSSEADLERLEATVPGLQGITVTADIATFLTVAFQQASSEEWVKRFVAADIAAAQPQSIETLRAQYSREADGFVGTDLGSFAFSVHADHPSGHCLTQIDHYAIRPTNSLIRSISPAERHGQSTREILQTVDYSAVEIDLMIANKVAALGWTHEHLPSDHGDQSFAIATAKISLGQTVDLLVDMDEDPGLIV